MTQLKNQTNTASGTLQVDFDCARLAYEIVTSGVRGWPTGTVPARPTGVSGVEIALQATTLVAPLTGLTLVWAMFGNTAAAVAAPVALLAGYLLDRVTQRVISRNLAAARARDKGVYDHVRELAVRLNKTPEEITPLLLGKMAQMFIAEAPKRVAEVEAQHAARAEALRHAAARKPARRAAAGAAGLAAGGAAGMAYDEVDTGSHGYPSTPDYAYDSGHYGNADHSYNPYPDVNPGSGLPMIEGTPIDVGGHVFGSGYD